MVPKELVALACAQAGAVTRAQALGFVDARQLARLARTRQLIPLRREVYGLHDDLPARCSARLLRSIGDCVVSHATAAELYGYARLGVLPDEPELTRHRPGHEPPTSMTGLRVAELLPSDRAVVQGVAATSAARTVVDCARTLPVEEAVVIADSALRAGAGRAAEVLEHCAGWPGVVQAREVLAFADARADSALESRTRWRLAQQGIAVPELQITLCTTYGRDVGEVDFLWREQRTILEVDGRLKYTSDEVLWREKRREDALRALGFEVVRGFWSDTAEQLAAKVQAGFAQAGQYRVRPDYGVRERANRHAQRLR